MDRGRIQSLAPAPTRGIQVRTRKGSQAIVGKRCLLAAHRRAKRKTILLFTE